MNADQEIAKIAEIENQNQQPQDTHRASGHAGLICGRASGAGASMAHNMRWLTLDILCVRAQGLKPDQYMALRHA